MKPQRKKKSETDSDRPLGPSFLDKMYYNSQALQGRRSPAGGKKNYALELK